MGPPIAPQVGPNSPFGPNYVQSFRQPAFVPPNRQLAPQQQLQEQIELRASRQFVAHRQQQQQQQQQQQPQQQPQPQFQQPNMHFQPRPQSFVGGHFYSQQPTGASQQNFQQQQVVQHLIQTNQSSHIQTIAANFGSQNQGYTSATNVYQSLLQQPHQQVSQHQDILQQQDSHYQQQQQQWQRMTLQNQRQQMLLSQNHRQLQQQQQIQQQQYQMLQQTSRSLTPNSRVQNSLQRSSPEVRVRIVQPDHQNQSQGQTAQRNPTPPSRISSEVSVRLVQSDHQNQSQGRIVQRNPTPPSRISSEVSVRLVQPDHLNRSQGQLVQYGQVSSGITLQSSTIHLPEKQNRDVRISTESLPHQSLNIPSLPKGVTIDRVQVTTIQLEPSSSCAPIECIPPSSPTVKTSAQASSDDLTTPQLSPSDDPGPSKGGQLSRSLSKASRSNCDPPTSSKGSQPDGDNYNFYAETVNDLLTEFFSRKLNRLLIV
jgi:hypothetical protein